MRRRSGLRRGLAAAVLLLAATRSTAQCDPANFFNFGTQAVRPQDFPPITVPSQAFSEGSFAVSPALTGAPVDAGLQPTQGGAGVVSIAASARFAWRLIYLGPLNPAQLAIRYSLDNGSNFVSDLDPGSRIAGVVATERLDVQPFFFFNLVSGFLTLQLDPTNASRAGPYSGNVSIEVDCL